MGTHSSALGASLRALGASCCAPGTHRTGGGMYLCSRHAPLCAQGTHGVRVGGVLFAPSSPCCAVRSPSLAQCSALYADGYGSELEGSQPSHERCEPLRLGGDSLCETSASHRAPCACHAVRGVPLRARDAATAPRARAGDTHGPRQLVLCPGHEAAQLTARNRSKQSLARGGPTRSGCRVCSCTRLPPASSRRDGALPSGGCKSGDLPRPCACDLPGAPSALRRARAPPLPRVRPLRARFCEVPLRCLRPRFACGLFLQC